ncbi:MAG: PEGA domain-containing protein [Clostridiales bacterium]|jgi:hypothetical protein|nr:PEGA domain-containing protein [Clostridiales bacterium]
MSANTKEQKNKFRIHTRPILSLLIGLTLFTVILFFALNEAGGDRGSGIKTVKKESQEAKVDQSTYKEPSHRSTAIVLEIDKSEKAIRFYDINESKEIVLKYTGGTNLLDKFGQVISIGQVEIGWITDIGYDANNNKLSRLQYSEKAWEYIKVNDMVINPEEKTINIANSKYTYKDPIVMDIDGFITLEDLAIQDELTVRGIDETIYTILVTKGHGTVKIKDYEAFLGGSITVGYEAVMQITDNMSIRVREGNYNLTVENGEYSGTKNITVYRNEETIVSIGDMGPEPTKYGKTTFEISPFGADLFIDGELTTYANPIELAYDDYNIEVSLGGYSTYSGTLKVDYASKKIQIVLPELESMDTVSVVELVEREGQTDNIEYNDWDSEEHHSGDDSEYIDSFTDDEDFDNDPIIDSESLIYIQNPSGASVYLNGKFKGESPGSFGKVIGRHVLTFIKKGYQTKSYTIDIVDDGLDTYINLPDLVPEG